MTEDERIVVEDLATLVGLIERHECWVRWEVTCEVGPDWLGGRRSIEFHVGSRRLAETAFHDRLRAALVEALAIPSESADAVIRGEGTVRWEGGRLEMDYEWSEAVPYQDPRDGGVGTARLDPS